MKNSINDLYNNLNKESSPKDLDNFILNQAKQSCQKSPKKSHSRTWMYSLSTAAVFVFGLSLIININNQTPTIQPNITTYSQPTTTSLDTDFDPKSEAGANNESSDNIIIKTPTIEKTIEFKHDELNDKYISESFISKIPKNQSKPKPTSASEPVSSGIEISASQTTINRSIEKVGRSVKSNPQKITQTPVVEISKGDNNKTVDSIVENNEIEEESDQADDELGAITVTGSRIKISESELDKDITELKLLIKKKKGKDARALLRKLLQKYPDYDFAEIEELIR